MKEGRKERKKERNMGLQGVFITAKNSRGQRVPMHMQKSTTSQVIGCEAECREFMTLAKLIVESLVQSVSI
ncbi:unnamed protein product [Leuciscus chuanchicus]